MRVVYMGTPAFALPALERLLDSRHEVVGVVTQPDKPAGRGQKLLPPPVKSLALERGLKVLQPASLKTPEAQAEIAALQPDILAVAAYGKIIPTAVFAAPRFGSINIHPSMLPKYRGAAPIQRAIMNGDYSTGVSIMVINEGLDSGPIIQQEEIDILDDDDAVSLGNMLASVGAAMLIEALDKIEASGEVEAVPQDDRAATYAEKISVEDGVIDWSRRNDELICQIRALIEWPAAYTFYDGARVKILKAQPGELSLKIDEKRIAEIPPGTISDLIKGYGPVVRTGNGFLLLQEVKMEGKKSMSGADIVNGRLLEIGKHLAPQVS